jgi:hypothetical protein
MLCIDQQYGTDGFQNVPNRLVPLAAGWRNLFG